MADTEKLQKMLDDLINDKAEQAQVNFHEYLEGKMRDAIKNITTNSEKQKE